MQNTACAKQEEWPDGMAEISRLRLDVMFFWLRMSHRPGIKFSASCINSKSTFALELLVCILKHLLEPSALPVPHRREQNADVLALELINGNLLAISLDESLAQHTLDICMTLVRPRKQVCI